MAENTTISGNYRHRAALTDVNAFIVSSERAALNPAHGEADAEIRGSQRGLSFQEAQPAVRTVTPLLLLRTCPSLSPPYLWSLENRGTVRTKHKMEEGPQHPASTVARTARPSGSPSLTSPSFPPPIPTGVGTWTPPRGQAPNSPGQSWLPREEPGHVSRTSGPISTRRRASSSKNGSAGACEDHAGGKGRGEQGSPDPPQPPPLTALSLRCQGLSITRNGESGLMRSK